MRDLLIVGIVVVACLMALKRPWIGVMLWTWLSIMNPHRYAYGFSYEAPLAAMAVGFTLLGLLNTKEKESPFKGAPVTVLVLLMIWITITSILGFDPEYNFNQWKKIMKIDFMIIVALALLYSKRHILALTIVAAGSVAILGAKGGLFTLATGGNFRVWGPPGSFIEDNNEFALAVIMTIPLLRLLQLQISQRWGKYVITAIMVLCAAAAVGSHSRGGFLAILAMGAAFWWYDGRKIGILIGMLVLASIAPLFLPEEWFSRMDSISDYQNDSSAMGRINAWWMAWNLATDRFFGGGFAIYNLGVFSIYAPIPDDVHAAHSIYFQILGEHGFVGLFLFILLWWLVWYESGKLRVEGKKLPETLWISQLGAMCQVSMIGYLVGGTFLSLAYFDLPYNIMVIVVLARRWIDRKAWLLENEKPSVANNAAPNHATTS
ncbi:MAG: putative O-glycosylation ligase, exosortase A system-associated [Betaproteobacteria bacterium]|nr:putative O-glycosylation ligase, exosortase A system-associated [Betaproteobacteria bacterium]